MFLGRIQRLALSAEDVIPLLARTKRAHRELPGVYVDPTGESFRKGDLVWVAERWSTPLILDPLAPAALRKPERLIAATGLYFDQIPREYLADRARVAWPVEGHQPHHVTPGRPRTARSMPESLARVVLKVIARRTERLRDMNESEIEAQGFSIPWHYAAAWDARHRAHQNPGISWAADPTVEVLYFDILATDHGMAQNVLAEARESRVTKRKRRIRQ